MQSGIAERYSASLPAHARTPTTKYSCETRNHVVTYWNPTHSTEPHLPLANMDLSSKLIQNPESRITYRAKTTTVGETRNDRIPPTQVEGETDIAGRNPSINSLIKHHPDPREHPTRSSSPPKLPQRQQNPPKQAPFAVRMQADPPPRLHHHFDQAPPQTPRYLHLREYLSGSLCHDPKGRLMQSPPVPWLVSRGRWGSSSFQLIQNKGLLEIDR